MSDDTRHTPGPWSVDKKTAHVNATDGKAVCAMLWPTVVRSEEETRANADLIARAPDLLAENASLRAALEAQELASQMVKEPLLPFPDDPRYTPYIGEWDGYQAPEVRLHDFIARRREMRKAALAQSGGNTLQPAPGKDQP